MISMSYWMAAVGLASFMLVVFHFARKVLPYLAPVVDWMIDESYHHKYSAHRKTNRYTSRELADLDQSNFSVPENHISELPEERTWSEITAQYEREQLAAYEREDTGELRPLPFNMDEVPAATSYPRSNVRVYWEASDTRPDILPWQQPPQDEYSYDGRRWTPTEILEPVS